MTKNVNSVTDEVKHIRAQSTYVGEFYEDILRFELTGPRQPHLTMADLPGLFRRGNKEQSDDDVDIVRGMATCQWQQRFASVL